MFPPLPRPHDVGHPSVCVPPIRSLAGYMSNCKDVVGEVTSSAHGQQSFHQKKATPSRILEPFATPLLHVS